MPASEHQEQVALFQWAAVQSKTYPALSLLFAIPNGGHRNKVTASKLKAEGVKPGVPDICLPVPRAGYHALFIELKRKTGGKGPTADQRKWIDALSAFGYLALVCKGWDEAKVIIENYLSIGDEG